MKQNRNKRQVAANIAADLTQGVRPLTQELGVLFKPDPKKFDEETDTRGKQALLTIEQEKRCCRTGVFRQNLDKSATIEVVSDAVLAQNRKASTSQRCLSKHYGGIRRKITGNLDPDLLFVLHEAPGLVSVGVDMEQAIVVLDVGQFARGAMFRKVVRRGDKLAHY